MEDRYEKLRTALAENHSFPHIYTFKFVVPLIKKDELLELIPIGELTEKESSGGKYVSLTIKSKMSSPDHIISSYKKVAQLKGVIAL